MNDSLPDSRVGTPHYLAPEVFKLSAGESYDAQVHIGNENNSLVLECKGSSEQ